MNKSKVNNTGPSTSSNGTYCGTLVVCQMMVRLAAPSARSSKLDH
jgi:hypothetical protein